jgi:4-amino-4-deoxy-L-arabinose transferase-like glycosyltransferase
MTWPALLDRRWFAFALVAVWAFAYLPHLGTRTLRLEEGRRATPAREMLASGDFVVPTLYGDTYLNKPPLFFWIIAATGTAIGEIGPLATRIPSVLAALGCALVALRFAPDVLERRTRSLAALFVLASATLLDKGTLGEIDATLCFVMAAALKVWWDGNRPAGQSPGSWIGVGLLLGVAGLLKGPAGPAMFYLTVVPFLIWQRRWPRLFTFSHVVCLVLAVLPAAAWVAVLLDRGVVSVPELLTVWGRQLGADNAADAVVDPAARTRQLVAHYSEFPFHVLGLLFPAVLWLPHGLRRRWAAAHMVPEDLRRFLLCGVLGPCLAIYLYPESRPRHLMPAFFPAAILAATIVSAFTTGVSRWGYLWNRLGLLIGLIPAVAGAMGLALAAWSFPTRLPMAIVVFAIGGVWSALCTRANLHMPSEHGVFSLAAGQASALLAVSFVVNALIVPWQAPLSATHVAIQAVEGKLAPGETLYTTRTFPGKGEGLYNLQFHLAERVQAADVESLKRAAPCVAVVTPDEHVELEQAGLIVEEVARMELKGPQPEVIVIRIR